MKKFKRLVSIMMLAAAVVFAAGCTKPDEPNNGGDNNGGGDNGGGNGGGVTPEVPTIPAGAVDGLFTINEHGGHVYFSQGNLQYQASTNTFRFAENQWDMVGGSYMLSNTQEGNVAGSDNCLVSNIYSGWVDLFGYGTSGWQSGYVRFEPYAISNSPDGFLNKDLNGEYAKADWGVFNPISNGGNQAGQWRVPTKDEWEYIINGRNGTRYARAQVNGVNGIILVPDDWDASIYEFKSPNSGGSNWDVNTIYQSIWENTLEPAGCVFLPNAGWRSINSIGIHVTELGSYGNYWTATAWQPATTNCAYKLSVGWQGPGVGNGFVNSGYAVRMVQDAE